MIRTCTGPYFVSAVAQKHLAGSAGIRTDLLRMPLTAQVDMLCGAEWTAAQGAAADGCALVAADRPDRDPAHGQLRRFSQTDLAYEEAKDLLAHPHADRFTTVTEALDMPSADTRVSTAERWQGKALIWSATTGHACTDVMTWTLPALGVLGVWGRLLPQRTAGANRHPLHRTVPRD